jgi:hypothetical protein
MELLVPSRVRDVTVFRSGAMVTRVAEVRPDERWPEEVAVADLPLSVDEGSVRIRLEAAERAVASLPQLTDVRVEWVVPPLGEPVEPPSETELRASLERIKDLEQRLTALAEECANHDRLALSLPARIEKEPPRPVFAATLAGVADWVARARLSRAAESGKLRRALREAREGHARLERRVAESRAERGIDEDRVCKRIVARLRASGPTFPLRLIAEYRVPGACWRPTYVVRVARDGKSATIAVRALVAQQSGEPWQHVRLVLSTADLQRHLELPVLKSQRIGRTQPEPAQRGFREPPSGAETLFEGLDNAVAAHREGFAADRRATPVDQALPPPVSGGAPPPPPPMIQASQAISELATESDELTAPGEAMELEEAAPERQSEPRRSMPPPAPSAAPLAMRLSASMAAPRPAPAPMKKASGRARREMEKESKKLSLDDAYGGEADGAPQGMPVADSPASLPPAWGISVEYHLLRVVAWSAPAYLRGQLRPMNRRDLLAGLTPNQYARAEQLAYQAESRARSTVLFPITTSAVEDSAGSFDYAFAAANPLDVPNDGKLHNVPLFAKDAPVELTLVAVPRESDEVVRVASLKNPLGAPILAGPADIYLENEFLVTSRFATEPAGASVSLGLGVEPALKVARNTHFKEATEGLLSGSFGLRHEVEIEVASRLPSQAQVEVRERVPLYGGQDKEIVVETGEVNPPWESFNQGAPNQIQGGKRWRFALPSGATRKLSFAYTVRIDSKNELVGGNRRD